MKYQNRTPEQKFAIVMEGIKEIKPIAEICRQHQISQTLFYKWRDKFLQGAVSALENRKNGKNDRQDEIQKLQNIIGQQTIIIETLKKNDGMFRKKSR
ncbi:MAG TPA: transposase [Clostridia bacterium]|nr:transposase [Clostridia bacterium]